MAFFPLPHCVALCMLALTSCTASYINPSFVGFSVEVSGILDYIGRYPATPRQSYVQLYKNLAVQPGTGGPNLRVGGNSADESWWNPSGAPNPPGVDYSITSVDLLSLRQFADAVNNTVVFGLNFRQPTDPSWAVNNVKAIGKYFAKGDASWPRVKAVEIGNECDLFSENGIRNSSFTYWDYEHQFQAYAAAVVDQGGLPHGRIQGATWCCSHFDDHFDHYMDVTAKSLRTVSYHRYPENHCHGDVATIAGLLDDKASVGQASYMAPYAAHARSLGLPYWIGESNSVACGGMPGVSNVFAAALWVVDYLFNMAAVGVQGVNFHGGIHGAYTPVYYNTSTSPQPYVRPLYYGMLVFAESTSGMCSITSDVHTSVSPANPMVKAWAVSCALPREYRVVIIHKDVNATSPVQVTISVTSSRTSTSSSDAQLSRLTAPSVTSETGLQWAGQTFDGSKDGTIQGQKHTEPIAPQDGHFTFSVSPGSVAVWALQL